MRSLPARGSADGTEVWGNWVLRVTGTGQAAGELQATLPASDPSAGPALVAWVLAPAFRATAMRARPPPLSSSACGQRAGPSPQTSIPTISRRNE